jgi:DNA invertase Pin-like site-specific DNA recombinase
MRKTATYIRISTSDKQTTDSQEGAIQRWIESKGYSADSIIDFRDEGISGATESRPGFQKLLQFIRAGLVERIITFEMSRLSRDMVPFLNFLTLCREHSVAVETPEGAEAFESSIDMLMQAVKGFASQTERERISSRTKAGVAAAKSRGVRLGRPPGTRTNKGHRKQHDPGLVADIIRLVEKNFARTEIANWLRGKYATASPSTVRRIIRRYAAGCDKPFK